MDLGEWDGSGPELYAITQDNWGTYLFNDWALGINMPVLGGNQAIHLTYFLLLIPVNIDVI